MHITHGKFLRAKQLTGKMFRPLGRNYLEGEIFKEPST
jgi:hypothetical protein